MEHTARLLRRGIRVRARTFWGGTMHVILPERVSTSIHRYGFFEPDLTRIVLECVRPGMVFYDIGAHFGYYSLLASELVGPAGHVCSFEPTSSTFEVLVANLASRGNATQVNRALWSEPKVLRFRDYGLRDAAFNSLGDERVSDNMARSASAREYEVQTITIDEYVRSTGQAPAFVKMDAEGAETAILLGMAETLKTHRPLVTVEVGDQTDETGSKSREIIDQLLASDYVPFEWRNDRLEEHVPLDRYVHNNLLFRPR